jgi:hypothetical protein
MDEVLRQRLWRHIEALPDEQVYQVLDYIEFLASKYHREGVRSASSFQRFGERLQDKMRAQQVGVRAIRGTLEAVGTADRVFSGIAEAGRSLLREVEEGLRSEARPEDSPPPRALPKPRSGPDEAAGREPEDPRHRL